MAEDAPALRRTGPRRFAFALGTFHAGTLVVVGVLLAYRNGGVESLGDLNTVLGLGLFALLWAASVAGTEWALRDVRVHTLDVALRRGIAGGVRSALLVLVVVIVFVVASVPFGLTDEGGLAGLGNMLVVALYIVGVYGVLGGVVAAVVGGAIGFVFAVIDWLVLCLAGIGDGFDPAEELARR